MCVIFKNLNSDKKASYYDAAPLRQTASGIQPFKHYLALSLERAGTPGAG